MDEYKSLSNLLTLFSLFSPMKPAIYLFSEILHKPVLIIIIISFMDTDNMDNSSCISFICICCDITI